MRTALLLENDKPCHLDKDIERKKLKAIIFSIDEFGQIHNQNDYIFHQNIGYLSLWILNKHIKKILVSYIDPDIRLLLEKLGVVIKEKGKLADEPLLKNYIHMDSTD